MRLRRSLVLAPSAGLKPPRKEAGRTGPIMDPEPANHREDTMADKSGNTPRCAVLVGPYLSGKTSLFEALLLDRKSVV